LVKPEVSELVAVNNDAGESFRKMGDTAKYAEERTRAWHQAVLASYNSQIALEQAIDDASKTIKDNGATLDVNTQKGRDNKTALLRIGAAALQAADDAKKSGASTEGAMNRGYNAFIKAARGAGLGAAQARNLARQIGLVPASRSTRFTNNADAARARVASLMAIMNNIPRQIASTIAVNLAYSGLSQNTGAGNRARHGRRGGIFEYAAGGLVQGFPAGGPVSGPGTGTSDSIAAMLSNGEYVINAAATRAWRPVLDAINYGSSRQSVPAGRSAAPAGASPTIIINVAGSIRSDRDLVELVRQGLAGRSVLQPGRNGALIPRAA
jgi:hypothetical protein